MKRKILSIIATLFMSLGMVSCNNKAEEKTIKIDTSENFTTIESNNKHNFETRYYKDCVVDSNQIKKIDKIEFGDIIIDLNQYDFYKVYVDDDVQYVYWADCLKDKTTIDGTVVIALIPYSNPSEFCLEYYDRNSQLYYLLSFTPSNELLDCFENKCKLLDVNTQFDVYMRFQFSIFAYGDGWIK